MGVVFVCGFGKVPSLARKSGFSFVNGSCFFSVLRQPRHQPITALSIPRDTIRAMRVLRQVMGRAPSNNPGGGFPATDTQGRRIRSPGNDVKVAMRIGVCLGILANPACEGRGSPPAHSHPRPSRVGFARKAKINRHTHAIGQYWNDPTSHIPLACPAG